ncbi:MAG TPA: ABC transporter permease [Thermoanaerobaculia bacterium]|jgi:putative ABC transport system permease protein|nr:ABC transporter permease [Thermoanaerobaculia bacterium]
MNSLFTDLRYAVRGLRKSPGYTSLCVLTLALGIGANGAIFSLVDRLMLRPLPFAQPDRLALAYMTNGGSSGNAAPDRLPWSYPKFEAFAHAQGVFAQLAPFVSDSINLTGAGAPERLEMEMVGPDYFHLLGVPPVIGRGFGGADAKAGGPVVAMVGEGLWRRRFGGDESILGRTLHLGRVPVTVVGVVPAGFHGLTGEAEVWVPVTAASTLWYPEALSEEHNHFLEVVGRLRPGVSRQQLESEMERIGKVVAAAFPVPAQIDDGSVWGAGGVPLAEARRDPFVRRALVVLLAAVGAVLPIACANLAGLATARAASRRRDVAVRLAVGASGGRLVRMAMLESVVLALAGAVAGLVPAVALVRGLTAMRPEALGAWGVRSTELHDLAGATVDWRVATFCGVVALLTSIVFGLGPALASRRLQVVDDLRKGGASLAGGAGHGRRSGRRPAGSLLVAGQLAVATVLLMGAGLLMRSLWALQRVPVGVRTEHVLTFAVTPADGAYGENTAGPFHERLLERLRALPGVESAALGTCVPAAGESGCNSTRVMSVDAVAVPRESAPAVGWHKVSPDYFRALGVPLRAGRTFDARDRDGSRRVVILNETAARRLFPRGDAVGHRVQLGTMGLNGEQHGEIVGVVADVRYRRLQDEPRLEAYLPDAQVTLAGSTAFLRTTGDPLALVPAVRAAVQSVDRDLPIYRVRTMKEQLGFALSKARFGSLLLLVFAALAMGLAAVGVYGVLSQSVDARRREIGLRLAVGAAAREVEGLVLRQGMQMALAGTLAGVALSLAAGGVLRSLLFGVPARDPSTLAATAVLLLGVALLACLLPARRAARLDPTLLLRQE